MKKYNNIIAILLGIIIIKVSLLHGSLYLLLCFLILGLYYKCIITIKNNRNITKELVNAYKNIENASFEKVHLLALTIKLRDNKLGAHILRVGLYTEIIANELKMPEGFTEVFSLASQLHDIGKIHIDDGILKKDGSLFTNENKMQEHTVIGAKILADSDDPIIKLAHSIALFHHEKYDGTGYPNKLKGDDIPAEARIVMLCDVYDTLRMENKKALSHDETKDIIVNGDDRIKSSHFDPIILEAFKKIHHQFESIFVTSITA